MTPGGSIESTTAYNSMNTFGFVAAAGNRPDDDASPKGFVTILLFDKNYNFLDAGWDQLDGAYEQTGVMDNDPFDLLEKEVTVKEEGYVYIFVSNENPTQVEIHFDDLKVTHTKTNVIQYNEYYPFGLQASTSWTRENSSNNFLYNEGGEINSTSGWYDLPYRNYDAALGRFMQVDPLATLDASTSTFAYAGNNPVYFNDPLGLQAAAPPGVSQMGWDRYNKINDRNNPNYFSDWSDSFGGSGTFYITENREWVTNPRNPTTVDPEGGYWRTTYSISSTAVGDGWRSFYKNDLEQYAEKTGVCTNCNSNQLGTLFENIFNDYVVDQPAARESNFTRHLNPIFSYGDRNTKPDFTADAYYVNPSPNGSKLPALKSKVERVPQGTWYEAKAMRGALYASSNEGQINGHIDNLYQHTLGFREGHPGFVPGLYIVTTADVRISQAIFRYAGSRVNVFQFIPQFKIVNGAYQFRFVAK